MKVKKLTPGFGFVVERSNNEDLLDLSVAEVRSLIREGGVLLFRGFELNQEKFANFTSQFSNKMLKHAFSNYRKTLSADGTIAEVFMGNGDVELHGEMYYRPDPRPELLWLYCVTPAADMGATTVCDGVQFFESLSASTQDLLKKKKIKYTHTSIPSAWEVFAGTKDINEAIAILQNTPGVSNVRALKNNYIHWEFTTSALVQTQKGKTAFINSIKNMLQYIDDGDDTDDNMVLVHFEDGKDLPKDVLKEIDEVSKKLVFPIKWNANEIAVVDNSRMMHGRERFEGQRFIMTRFSMAS